MFIKQSNKPSTKSVIGRSAQSTTQRPILKKAIAAIMVGTLCTQTVGCGFLLHPERQGQTSGQLDPGIVVLNAVGLFFFVVPGIVAFAIDFTYGTIYLPNGQAALPAYPATADDESVTKIQLEGPISEERIEQVIFEHTGKTIDVQASHVYQQNHTVRIAQAF